MAKFKARARTVEMLGRQQIAGIPTAISELFKNAHDAYADRVEVDYFRKTGLFVLRDDGLGMSQEDFERRWLALGTESKLLSGTMPPPRVDADKTKRPVLGEKGIGRLAIAAIGSQVLVLTRAKATSGIEAPLVVALIHWGLFGLPGIDLDQIDIPMGTLPPGELPGRAFVQDLIRQASLNLTKLIPLTDQNEVVKIRAEMQSFQVDPDALNSVLGAPTLGPGGHGTHFFIFPTDESLATVLDAPTKDDDVAAPLYKTLVGFTNTMTPGHPKPVIETAFRDHKSDDVVDDVIEANQFFTEDEFQNADHHISGEFDAFGQFRGSVTVYGEPTDNYVVPWPAKAQPTDCGPFRFNLAVVQGVASQSTVPTDDWALISRKMNQIGGLYIYRDGIRVLPYGNADYDFLDIERNRTKSASYYYFSYRRIFGVIELDREHNGRLHEKAGREGFRENRAYHQFRAILSNFFVQVAADFFREGSSTFGRYDERRTELLRLDKAKRARDKHVSVRRAEFRKKITQRSLDLSGGVASERVASTLATFGRDLKAAESEGDPDRAAKSFLRAESAARLRLTTVKDDFRITAPRGVGLSGALRKDFEAYRDECDSFFQKVLGPAYQNIESLLGQATQGSKAGINRRVRFDNAIEEVASTARRNAQAEGQEARSAAEDVSARVRELARTTLQQVEQTLGLVRSRAEVIDVTKLDDAAFVAQRSALESNVEVVAENTRRIVTSITDQLRAIATHLQNADADTSPLDAEEALEEEVIALRERADADLELAQLGMAVQVINHEFDATIRAVRRNIRELRAWADANDSLRTLYESIKDNFSHLDGYLSLFTPLQRRLYRSVVQISGADIFRFLEDLFGERLKRHAVRLTLTPAFKKHVVSGYPSTFYPVFVNLVDNAIFWASRKQGERVISLDAVGDTLIVADNGPGIAERDREAIFDIGFTRKPGGRGLGLHISRQVLSKANYKLESSKSSALGGAQFEISPLDTPAPSISSTGGVTQ